MVGSGPGVLGGGLGAFPGGLQRPHVVADHKTGNSSDFVVFWLGFCDFPYVLTGSDFYKISTLASITTYTEV